MAFAFVEVKGSEASSADPSVSFAGTPTDGDLLVMVFQAGGGTTLADLTLPAGYTVRTSYTADGRLLFIADKVAASTGKPQTITWANAGAITWSMAIYRYTGQAASDYFDQAAAGASLTGTSIQPGSVTPTNAGELFIAAARQSNANGGTEAIDSSFGIDLPTTFARLVVGDKIKGGADAAAENPILSWATSTIASALMVCYSTTAITPGAGQPTARRWEHVPHVRLGRGGPIRVGG